MRVLQQWRRQCHAALPVELARLRAAEEVALHQAALAREAIEARVLLADVVVPSGARPYRDAAVEAPSADDALREMLAQARGQRDAVLVIQPLLELSEEHTGPPSAPELAPDLPMRTTLSHRPPHCNTA
jgi:hypothetical protein